MTNSQQLEMKYLLEHSLFASVLQTLKKHMTTNDHSLSAVTAVYFDTPDFQLAQNAVDGCLDSYNVCMEATGSHPTEKTPVSLAVKKTEIDRGQEFSHKFLLQSNPISVHNFVKHGLADDSITDRELIQEVTELRCQYGQLVPKIYFHYERLLLKDAALQISFAQNLIFRDSEVSLMSPVHGSQLLNNDQTVMTVRASKELPSWLSELLEEYQLRPLTFSKYIEAYLKLQARKAGLDQSAVSNRYLVN